MGVGDNALDSTFRNKSGSVTGMSSGSAGFAFSSQTRGAQGSKIIPLQYQFSTGAEGANIDVGLDMGGDGTRGVNIGYDTSRDKWRCNINVNVGESGPISVIASSIDS